MHPADRDGDRPGRRGWPPRPPRTRRSARPRRGRGCSGAGPATRTPRRRPAPSRRAARAAARTPGPRRPARPRGRPRRSCARCPATAPGWPGRPPGASAPPRRGGSGSRARTIRMLAASATAADQQLRGDQLDDGLAQPVAEPADRVVAPGGREGDRRLTHRPAASRGLRRRAGQAGRATRCPPWPAHAAAPARTSPRPARPARARSERAAGGWAVLDRIRVDLTTRARPRTGSGCGGIDDHGVDGRRVVLRRASGDQAEVAVRRRDRPGPRCQAGAGGQLARQRVEHRAGEPGADPLQQVNGALDVGRAGAVGAHHQQRAVGDLAEHRRRRRRPCSGGASTSTTSKRLGERAHRGAQRGARPATRPGRP